MSRGPLLALYCFLTLCLLLSTSVVQAFHFRRQHSSSPSNGNAIPELLRPSDSPRSPVILIPGDGGSQFEAKLNKSAVVHIWCSKFTDDWFPLWLNIELLVPYALDCFTDNMKLIYDPKTRTTQNPPGVMTRQLGFGNTSTVEWLDSSHFTHTEYFYPIADTLVKNLGYVRNVNIRGAPYDFRKAPNELAPFIDAFRQLVEDTYNLNNGSKVVLLGHSMGNPCTLYMLYQQSQAWKDKYIKSFIALGGPWAGAAKTVQLMASGDDLGFFVLNPLTIREEQRSMPSSAWLMPYDTVWGKDDVIVYGPKRNYTVYDYKQFFTDIGYETGYLMRQDTEPLIKGLQAPGVEVHCVHGVDVDTPETFKYTGDRWFDEQPTLTYGNGDGTVNIRSLRACLRWSGKQKQQVYHQEFKGVSHMEMLNDKSILEYIRKVLS